MSDLKPITALGAQEPKIEQIGSFSLTENPSIALASVAARLGKEAGCKTKLKKFLSGLDVPDVAATSSNDDFGVFWTGPDQWMIEADYGAHEMLAMEVKSALGDDASVTEQSDGWCRFDLQANEEGARASEIMQRLCAVDSAAMAENTVSRTSIEHLGCFVICRKANVLFSIYGPRSSAGSLHHALVQVMRAVD